MSQCALFAVTNRLPIRDKYAKWNKNEETVCLLCKQEVESINHLFFDCIFLKRIWFIAKSKTQNKSASCCAKHKRKHQIHA